VKDVDFGLSFPVVPVAIEEESLAAPADPQPEILPITQNGATPAIPNNIEDVEQPIAKKRRRSKSRGGLFDANTSAKRRKLDSDAPSSGQNTNAPRPLSVPDIFAIPDDDVDHGLALKENGELAINEATPLTQREQSPELGLQEFALGTRNTPSPPVKMRETEQVTESPANAPGSGHRARLIDQPSQSNSRLQDVMNSSPAIGRTTSSRPQRQSKRKEISASPLPEALILAEPNLSPRQFEGTQKDDLPLSHPTERLRREPRKSIKTLLVTANHTTKNADQDEDSSTEVNAIDDAQAAAILGKHYDNRSNQAMYPAGSPDLDDSVQPILPTTKQSRKRVHLSQKLPRRKRAKEDRNAFNHNAKKPTKRASVRTGSPIPVTVHRLTKRPLHNGNSSEPENLYDEIAYASRPGVNAVDVLSQVCTEIIGSGLDTLENGRRNAEDAELRREYKTKWSALRSFSDELQSRLLSHVSYIVILRGDLTDY
jgi:hypothetical protein